LLDVQLSLLSTDQLMASKFAKSGSAAGNITAVAPENPRCNHFPRVPSHSRLQLQRFGGSPGPASPGQDLEGLQKISLVMQCWNLSEETCCAGSFPAKFRCACMCGPPCWLSRLCIGQQAGNWLQRATLGAYATVGSGVSYQKRGVTKPTTNPRVLTCATQFVWCC